MTDRVHPSLNGLPKPTQESASRALSLEKNSEVAEFSLRTPESGAQPNNGNSVGGRPKLDREKVWQLSKQKRCWYCSIPCDMEAQKCPRCGRARFEPWAKTEIAQFLKMSESTVHRALKEMPEDYKPEVEAFVLPTDLEACESIKEWRKGIIDSTHLSTLGSIAPFKKICEGKIVPKWKCHPDKFDFEKMRNFISAYLEYHKAKKVPRHFRMAMRSFLASKRIAIPRGEGSKWGIGGEKESEGEYAHVKMTEDQVEQLRDYLSDDPQTQFFADYGIETCARAQAIIKTEIAKIDPPDETGLVTIRVYESKTDKTWTKYLLTTQYPHAKETLEELQAYLKAHPNRKVLFLDEGQSYDNFQDKMCKKLKEAYEAIGLTEPYFFKKPIHALRHVGAQIWLRRTNWDYVLVAKIGGWEDVQTLIKYYGEMPADILLQKIREIKATMPASIILTKILELQTRFSTDAILDKIMELEKA